MVNFYGSWTADGGVGTVATFLNVSIVLLRVSSVPEQYKKIAELSETSVTTSRHSDVTQNTFVFNISVNIGVSFYCLRDVILQAALWLWGRLNL